ncbi:glycosyltransferase family 39 protein [Patescibacteria group bacterium]|nr:glycosyltransferase family 39 protein [Patescibacteria group bacterium]
MEIGILFLIFIFSLVLLHRNLKLGINLLLILSVLLHKELFSIFKWDLLPVRFFMLAMFLYFLYKGIDIAYKNWRVGVLKTFFKDPFVILLLAIWLVRGVSIVFSKNIQASLLLYGFFSTIVVLGLVLYFVFRNRRDDVYALVKNYTYIVFALSLFGYVQLFIYTKYQFIIGALWNVPGHVARVGATFWDVNHFGALLATLLPVLGARILFEKELKTRIINVVMFFSLCGTLLLTSSRTSWIVALVSFITFLLVILYRYFGKKGIAGVLLAIVLLTIPMLHQYSIKDSKFRAYVKQNFHYRLDSFASHFMLLTGSYQIFEKYPILGGGYGSFFEHFKTTAISSTFFARDPAALNTRVPAHTIWGELLAETGILGLSVFLLFFMLILLTILYSSLTALNSKDLLLGASMFSALVGVFVAGVFYSYNSEFFWIIVFLYFTYGVASLPQEFRYRNLLTRFVSNSTFILISIVVIAGILIFSGLGTTHLIPWDEAIYAKVAKNMVHSGDYLGMTWQPNKLWFEKPPLGIWFESILMNIWGYGSFVVRLPSAVFGLLTVIMTFIFGKYMFGKKEGFIAAISLLTTFHFLQYSRYAMLDVILTFFISLSLALYYVAKQQKKDYLWLLAGASIGFAILTKGVVGFLPFVIIFVYELFLVLSKSQSFSGSLLKNYLRMFFASVLVFLPWHLYMYIKYGYEFIQSYLVYHVFNRAFSAIEDKGQPFHWYVIVLRVSMRLWFIPLLGAVPVAIYRGLKRDKRFVFLTLWGLVIFLFFSLAKSKVVWYIIPIYPVLSLMLGYFVQKVISLILSKLGSLNNIVINYLGLYIVLMGSLFYLFYNRGLIYTPDLTGSKARLLMLKDEKLGTEETLHVHSIEEPLILYYSDSPITPFDFSVPNKRIPIVGYEQRIILLTKMGRFPGYNSDLNGKKAQVVGEDGDFILWYYNSAKKIDKEEVQTITEQLAVTTDEVTKQSLVARKELLEARIASNGLLPTK